jgi:predicted permease
MTGLRVFGRRLIASLRTDRMARELHDEIASHLAEAAEEYVSRGRSPEEARLAALRSFGGVTQTAELHRDARSFAWVDDLRQDLRHTARSLAKSPGFTIVAILTLALGIGANTSIFTLLDAVVFKPLPVPKPHELITFYENGPGGSADSLGGTGRFLRFSYSRFERLQGALAPRGSIAAVTRTSRLMVRLPGETQRRFVQAQFVSGGYFGILGVPAARGRIVTPEDVRLDRTSPVALISDAFWRRSFGGSDAALGQTIVVNDVPLTIVGIAPRGFVGMWTDREADIWLPLTLQQPLHYANNSSSYAPIDEQKPWVAQDISWLNLVARVPGGDIRAALPALQAANRDGVVELANTIQNPKGRASMLAHTLAVESFSRGFSGLRAQFSDGLFALTGMVALVLLVTCANIANLLLARAAGQARDLGIRISLGATTGRLVRQCLTESLALAVLGGAIGVVFSEWGSSFLARQVIDSAGNLPLVFAPDARVLGFAAGISFVAAIVFGLVPAFGAVAAGRRAALVTNQRQVVGHSSLTGMRSLVVGQLALSVVVVFAALLFGRTLLNLMRIDPGFAVNELVTVSFDPISSGYTGDQLPGLARRLVEAARTVPGVVGASASTCGLIAGCSSSGAFQIEGAEGDSGNSLYRNWVSPGYFATAGIRLISGREFTDRDTSHATLIAVVNETIARRYFRGQDPIGKRLGYSKPDVEIVGVVRDARTQTLHDLPVPMVYFPIDQKPANQQPSLTNLDVRVAGGLVTVEQALRVAIRQSEPNLVLNDVGAMSRRLERDVTRERVVAFLALGFGSLTLLLAALGLYGVLSYGVARRTQEIGVRMALGARRAEVLGLVGGQGARLTIVGLAIGLLATAAASRYLSGLLFGVTPLDPVSFILVTMAFVLVTMAASLVPARRATHVDPLVALRCE